MEQHEHAITSPSIHHWASWITTPAKTKAQFNRPISQLSRTLDQREENCSGHLDIGLSPRNRFYIAKALCFKCRLDSVAVVKETLVKNVQTVYFYRENLALAERKIIAVLWVAIAQDTDLGVVSSDVGGITRIRRFEAILDDVLTTQWAVGHYDLLVVGLQTLGVHSVVTFEVFTVTEGFDQMTMYRKLGFTSYRVGIVSSQQFIDTINHFLVVGGQLCNEPLCDITIAVVSEVGFDLRSQSTFTAKQIDQVFSRSTFQNYFFSHYHSS